MEAASGGTRLDGSSGIMVAACSGEVWPSGRSGSMRAAIEDARSSGSSLAGWQQQPGKEIDRMVSRAVWQELDAKLD